MATCLDCDSKIRRDADGIGARETCPCGAHCVACCADRYGRAEPEETVLACDGCGATDGEPRTDGTCDRCAGERKIQQVGTCSQCQAPIHRADIEVGAIVRRATRKGDVDEEKCATCAKKYRRIVLPMRRAS